MNKKAKNTTLGDYIRSRRLSRALTIYEAADASGIHASYWGKLENGEYATPSPRHLQAIANVLGVAFENLYALVGYESPGRLPSFSPYLRAKYSLPPEAVAQLESYFELLRNHYGIPKDQPVFPPRPQPQNKKTGPPRRRP